MAVKGALERALERAKLRREHSGTDVARGAAAEIPATSDAGSVAPAAVQPMPRFPVRRYDPARCSEARVLMPDSDERRNPSADAAYRMLRTRVLQRTRANRWASIGITSAGPGEGKSVTALNLALAIAREKNNHVFLIDLDMRNPKMCAYLGVVPPREITTYFTGQSAPQDVFFSIGIPNLWHAGGLTRTEQASEMLASGLVEDLFAYIRTIAPDPLILIDLPPILSTDDAIILAPLVDACLLVVAEGKSTRDGAIKALDLLAEFKLAGIVLNRTSATTKDYYGY
jgi:protein-tyrosine kinase